MKQNSKWTLYQLLTVIVMGILILLVNQFMEKMILPNSSSLSIFIILLLVALFSWFYVLTYFQLKKHPYFLENKRWKVMPIILIVIGTLSFIAFVLLGNNGLLFVWMNQWKWLMLIVLVYFIGIYFYFILSVLLKVSQNKNKILNRAYIISIVSLLIIFVLFP